MNIQNLTQAEKQNAIQLLETLESLADSIDFYAKILDDKWKEYEQTRGNIMLAKEKYAITRDKLVKSGFGFPGKFTFESMQDKINQYKKELKQ